MTDLPPIYAMTTFQGQRSTIPSAEYAGLTTSGVIATIAPKDGPVVLTEKANAPHFVPCLLQVAPYVGLTAQRFPAGAGGKQRSSQHVTESAWFAFDCDDISPEAKATVLRKLVGFDHCAYSTHGHSKEAGKVRMRVLLFMDRALAPADWSAVWCVVNGLVFDGKADVATSKLHQCAAVWTAHPERVAQSFRHVGRGKPLDADQLLSMAPKPTARAPQFIPRPTAPGVRRSRYESALRYLDAGDYGVWLGGLMSLRAAVEVGDMADSEARAVWRAWTASAPASRQSRNGEAQYDPEGMWDRHPKPTTSPDILTASLFAKARGRAEQYLRAEMPGTLSQRALDAATYLATNHHNLFTSIVEAAK
jgi:hypothetical protein